MPDIVTNPFVIPAGTVQHGLTRVRALSQGVVVADAVPLLVWEYSYAPRYFFRAGDLKAELRRSGLGERSRVLGRSEVYDVVLGDRVLPGAAQRYPEAPTEGMRGAFTLTWSAMDTWFEEDEVIHFHARSPYVRVDTLASSRHVRVVVRGEVVAESRRPVMLTETGLPARYYLPRADVRMDLLTPTDAVSYCPYKGTARYWSVRVGDLALHDAVWGYEAPLREAHGVAGLVCFWPERSTDVEVYVDGVQIGV
ncbi:DUF427 domain-containing protein [Promicromonospora thailandica]|uniref:Uncharacterized conserved protein, DUF427 family n=1 Tax=Promicromonospora thailandica TaxID=765201 RepID=A0A9X2JYH8_9MICO|nr:DUF427 domain-containing protein [Promicromonospora thailandica]MCP2267228.1 Uncharacterized conserved protein, DUF427 family [Promicromonospora thailandica]BFF17463.1 DUF427 domain-containing protein [Promicromonospora thailandica]